MFIVLPKFPITQHGNTENIDGNRIPNTGVDNSNITRPDMKDIIHVYLF